MVPNYEANSVIESKGNDPKFIKCYNTTASAVANGTIVNLVEKWTTGVGVQMVMITPGTNAAVNNLIGIVNNPDSDGIDATSYGLVQVKGLYGLATTARGVTAFGALTASTPAANAHLEINNNAPTTFVDAGTVGGAIAAASACAICVERVGSTNYYVIYLLGRYHTIAAT